MEFATLIQCTKYNKTFALIRCLSGAQLLLTAHVLTNKQFPSSFSSS